MSIRCIFIFVKLRIVSLKSGFFVLFLIFIWYVIDLILIHILYLFFFILFPLSILVGLRLICFSHYREMWHVHVWSLKHPFFQVSHFLLEAWVKLLSKESFLERRSEMLLSQYFLWRQLVFLV